MHVSAIFRYVGGFGDLGDPMLPTQRGVSVAVMTVGACQDEKGRFSQSLALPRAGQNLCETREKTVFTNKGVNE